MTTESKSDLRSTELDAGLRAMFDQMIEGARIIDREYRYRYLNDAAVIQARRPREEMIGRRMTDVYPGIDKLELYRHLTACLNDSVPHRMFVDFTFPDGRKGWFDVHLAPVPMGALLLSMDVTERVLAEQELRRSVEALEEADRRRSELVTMLAHELRNPLAPILNGIHLLRGNPSSPEVFVTVTDMMDRQIRHLAHFVDDLLDVNRITHGKLTLQPERVDLMHVIRGVIGDQMHTFQRNGVALSAQLPDHVVWVEADRARLAQVFTNLLDNACKFTPPGGNVVVRLEASAPELALITVSDTGAGIRADAMPRIFEPLFQADTTLDRARGGLGLGLSVAKGLVELHQGTLTVGSKGSGAGTTVSVSLPREAGPAIEVPSHRPEQSGRVMKHVLVIEDNRDAARTLAMILDLWGYQVRVSHSGADGVDQAMSGRPDVVLCDIGLPGMDGFEVARTLRKDKATRSAKMIAITGYGREDDQARALDAGFDRILTKPVAPEVLRAELEVA